MNCEQDREVKDLKIREYLLCDITGHTSREKRRNAFGEFYRSDTKKQYLYSQLKGNGI